MFHKLYQFWILVLSVLALVGVGFIAYFAYQTFGVEDDGIRVDTSGTAVVTEIQQIGRLETAVYTIEKVIDAGTQGSAFEEFLFGDRILLIANGQVIAGIDFAQITAENIQIDQEQSSITISAPAPQIFFTRLDNEATRVYDRSQGLLTQGEQDLESTARAQAEVVIRDAACESGILQTAEASARQQLEQLLSAMGYQQVTINIPEGQC